MNNLKLIVVIFLIWIVSSCDLYKYSLVDNSRKYGHYWVEPWNAKAFSVWVCYDDSLPADIVNEEVIYSSIKYQQVVFKVNHVYYTNGILVTSKAGKRGDKYNVLIFDKSKPKRTIRYKTDDKIILDSIVFSRGGLLPIQFVNP